MGVYQSPKSNLVKDEEDFCIGYERIKAKEPPKRAFVFGCPYKRVTIDQPSFVEVIA